MSTQADWNHKDTWRKWGSNFMVEISRRDLVAA